MAIKRRVAIAGLVLSVLALCGAGVVSQYPPCGGYDDWQSSPYVLPYAISERYEIYQGNCTWGGHHGPYQYSYDFLMPIGTTVTAVRDGLVIGIEDGFPEGGPVENWVAIQHEDGTVASYSHLHSLLIYIGDEVNAGDPVGLSGNTGQTGGVPHLHFHVAPCLHAEDCGTLPVTFSNTDANPDGLVEDLIYEAR
jgi:murein DD-endopeptidase MepM/ murein hydrolase activator NlpD